MEKDGKGAREGMGIPRAFSIRIIWSALKTREQGGEDDILRELLWGLGCPLFNYKGQHTLERAGLCYIFTPSISARS